MYDFFITYQRKVSDGKIEIPKDFCYMLHWNSKTKIYTNIVEKMIILSSVENQSLNSTYTTLTRRKRFQIPKEMEWKEKQDIAIQLNVSNSTIQLNPDILDKDKYFWSIILT